MTQNTMPNAQNENYTEIGYLTVRVSTAGGAIPLEGAAVNIRSGDIEKSAIIYSLVTNADGITPTVSLPTPPRSASESPQDTVPPYSVYNVDVYAKDYIPAFFNNVPIFSGINSVQPAVLVPQIENSMVNSPRIVTETRGGGVGGEDI